MIGFLGCPDCHGDGWIRVGTGHADEYGEEVTEEVKCTTGEPPACHHVLVLVNERTCLDCGELMVLVGDVWVPASADRPDSL